MSQTPLGRFCWYELMTTDTGAARDFYAAVTGWGARDAGGDDMAYTEWTVGETAVGGAMELPEETQAAGVPPIWVAYVSTPDVDATLERAEELGGQATWGPKDVPGVGRIAGLADPHGANLALYQPVPDSPPPAVDPSTPGAFSWHELASDDWREARTFYEELLGWGEAGQHDMGPEMGMYHMFSDQGEAPPEESVGGMFDRGDAIPVASWILYVRVDDMERALEAVKAGGGTVANGPMEVPGGDLVAQCVDPQGAVFAVHWGPAS